MTLSPLRSLLLFRAEYEAGKVKPPRKKVMYPMPDLNQMKKSDIPPLAERLVLNYVAPGSRLRLRGDACQQVKDREWIFYNVKDRMILLIHETGTYSIVVDIEDIDWTGF